MEDSNSKQVSQICKRYGKQQREMGNEKSESADNHIIL